MFKDRAVHGFGLSIGTGIAMTALVDPTDELYDSDITVKRVPSNKYTAVGVNAYTIVRNIVQALSTEDKHKLLKRNYAKQLAKTAVEEFETIIATLQAVGKETYIYNDRYTVKRYFLPLPEPSKHTQAHILRKTEENALEILRKEYRYDRPIENLLNAVYISHMSLDLLTLKKPIIIDSHTGNTITYPHYYRRLRKYSKDALEDIPFTPETLYIFGDSARHIGTPAPKVKKDALRILRDAKCSPLRHRGFVRDTLKKSGLFDEILEKTKRIHHG